ncbi:MAG TPA: efflux RND transporter periplasmic adaptor subunit [Candidatus Polarisedimenticolaceae bacterium]|nr:efflux RND transporter periplasmic adaptor subunit [Candidatus Polarisedimenticolaceae bacterium]
MTTDLKEKLSALKIERDERPPSAWTPLRIGILAGIVIVAALGAWFALRPRPVPVKTAAVQETATSAGGAASVLNASGYVTARRQATVSSKITGKVVEVLVEEGMQVKEGQVLARLDGSQMQQALGLSEAQLEAARRMIVESEARLREATIRKNRITGLAAQGVAPQSDKDAVEAEVDVIAAQIARQREQARASEREVAIARQNLDDTVIRAPFDGVAISKNAQPGEIISPMSAGGGFTRTGISTIVDMSSLEIEVDVNEAYIQRVQPGQKVQATLDAYRDWQIPAHVITTIPAADRQKATVTVRIGFDQLDPRILPDMGIKVAFLADATSSGAPSTGARVVRVPRAAIRGGSGDEFVFVVKGEGQLERRAVKIGAGGDDPVDVVAGLSAGERVVVEGPSELKADMIVSERKE